jgi:MoxR-like ATPase
MATEPYSYENKEFNPGRIHRTRTTGARQAGDHRAEPVYVYDEDLILAVNVALATRRPLLVRGPSGGGKSSLARNAADVLGWRYYEYVVTSRTEARDMLWQVDLLRRLHDAQAASFKGEALGDDFTPYVKPGVLWWAFEPETAVWRGAKPETEGIQKVDDPSTGDANTRAVVLVDEIDKADPDVPNNLLVPLGSLRFQVEETGKIVDIDEAHAPLVFITTNEERELPKAFLRRCVEVKIELPTRDRLLEIGAAHFPTVDRQVLEQILVALIGPADPKTAIDATELSPAEFIDIVRAVATLDVPIVEASSTWKALSGIVIWKHGRTRNPPA